MAVTGLLYRSIYWRCQLGRLSVPMNRCDKAMAYPSKSSLCPIGSNIWPGRRVISWALLTSNSLRLILRRHSPDVHITIAAWDSLRGSKGIFSKGLSLNENSMRSSPTAIVSVGNLSNSILGIKLLIYLRIMVVTNLFCKVIKI